MNDEIIYLQQQLKNIEVLIQEQINEKETNYQLLSDVDKVNELKEGNELIVPISKGIFVKLILKEFKGFVVNVGSNVFIEKDLSGIKKLLEENISVLDENIKLLKQQEEMIINRINELQRQIEKNENK